MFQILSTLERQSSPVCVKCNTNLSVHYKDSFQRCYCNLCVLSIPPKGLNTYRELRDLLTSFSEDDPRLDQDITLVENPGQDTEEVFVGTVGQTTNEFEILDEGHIVFLRKLDSRGTGIRV